MSEAKITVKKKKTGGRAKGTPNKVTRTIKESFAKVLEDYVNGEHPSRKMKSNLAKDLADIVDPADRIRCVALIFPYVVPKLTSVEVKADAVRKTFRDELDELSGQNSKD